MRCVSLFIENNYNYLLNLSNRAVGIDFGGDLLNDLTLAYLEDDEKYEPLCIRGELMKYICRSIAICGFSKSTRFYYKYKKHNEKVARRYPIEILSAQVDIDSTITQQDLENQMDDAFSILKEIRWFDAEVFKSYYLHSHSLKSLSDATGIPKNTLYKSIQTAKDHLKENSERIR
tara:strand:- start:4018 stop:4542 length:525 start_codon:yes stop_codon:yes gene_type:complete